MDLPPSGWYPDPHGTPALLRWWDGSVWTHHTHHDEAAAAERAPAAGLQATTVQPGGAQPTRVQAAVQPGGAQPTTGAPSRAEPLTGAPTTPQPALPDTGGALAVTAAAAGAGIGTDGTQVLFLGPDAWQAPGGTSGDLAQYGYGYQEARRRRRRRWLMGGLAAGTAVAVGVIAVIVVGLGSSPAASVADQTPVTPSSVPTAAASPTPSASPSATASAPAATLSDGQSGLSYSQLGSPWQASCPAALTNGAFTWTSGESAVAGQVNGGQTTWYGEACSGPLPQQYGYTGVAALESTATNLVNTFQGAYYSALAHTATPEVSQPVTISGHAGWEITFDITYTNAQAQNVTWADEQAAVLVVDAGTGNTPAVFFTSIPANLGQSNVAALVSSLQLSAVPQATISSTPTDSGAPTGNGAPTDGGSPPAGANP